MTVWTSGLIVSPKCKYPSVMCANLDLLLRRNSKLDCHNPNCYRTAWHSRLNTQHIYKSWVSLSEPNINRPHCCECLKSVCTCIMWHASSLLPIVLEKTPIKHSAHAQMCFNLCCKFYNNYVISTKMIFFWLSFVNTEINYAVLSQSPELSDLMTLVAQKAPVKWLVIGIQLKIELSTLMGFKHRQAINNSSTSKCLIGGKESRQCHTPGAVLSMPSRLLKKRKQQLTFGNG